MKKIPFSYRFDSYSDKIKNNNNLSILEFDPNIADTAEILKSQKLQPIKETLYYRLENNALIIGGEAKPLDNNPDFDFAII